MGWGSDSVRELIWAILLVDNDKIRANIYRRMITALKDYGFDALDECCGIDLVFDEVLDEME